VKENDTEEILCFLNVITTVVLFRDFPKLFREDFLNLGLLIALLTGKLFRFTVTNSRYTSNVLYFVCCFRPFLRFLNVGPLLL